MKEPIKMHVKLSLLYKTLSIIEMRSKILKAKGWAAEWLQNSFEHFWHPFLDNRKLWLISYASLMSWGFWKIKHAWHDWSLHCCLHCGCFFNLCSLANWIPVFWEFLGIPRNSKKFPIMQMTLANWIPSFLGIPRNS